jgi:hypothetical protein
VLVIPVYIARGQKLLLRTGPPQRPVQKRGITRVVISPERCFDFREQRRGVLTTELRPEDSGW